MPYFFPLRIRLSSRILGTGTRKPTSPKVAWAVVDLVLAAARRPAVDRLAAPVTTAADFATTLDDLVESNIEHDLSIDQTVREQLVRARRGQGLFRARVLDNEPLCRITGITTPNLLIASHIEPWRACETAAERLDGANGLMMALHADFLFDRGSLGFERDGRPMFPSQLTITDAGKLGMHMWSVRLRVRSAKTPKLISVITAQTCLLNSRAKQRPSVRNMASAHVRSRA